MTSQTAGRPSTDSWATLYGATACKPRTKAPHGRRSIASSETPPPSPRPSALAQEKVAELQELLHQVRINVLQRSSDFATSLQRMYFRIVAPQCRSCCTRCALALDRHTMFPFRSPAPPPTPSPCHPPTPSLSLTLTQLLHCHALARAASESAGVERIYPGVAASDAVLSSCDPQCCYPQHAHG